MKKTISFILAAFMIFAVSCAKAPTNYKNNVSVSHLSQKVENLLGSTSDMTVVPDTYISNIMKIDLATFEEYAVFKQMTGATVDEYGIFKVANPDNVEAAFQSVKSYVDISKNASMVAEYMPEEAPKLANAEVVAMGEYVFYFILADDVKTAAVDAIENELTEK